ncbi:pirin family protein [Hyalangium gracile]|uniref:pirin family protein n=1 Tax=Hyalangium gracile TaxID=394092 RepID=UPI001CCEAFE0|nr:pirin-like C-terminal cupin domain-containing protein [Hyalangium gracile]
MALPLLSHRKLARVRTLPAPSPGQFGPAHTAIEVIRPHEWEDADPFILLMDDRLDGRLVAGPHPHAGFETVTFLVDGTMPAEHQREGALAAGDVEWTTAGSGIVHGPDAPIEGRMRVLQLWLTLPQAQRWTEPDHQFIRRDAALVRREPGAEVRLYSGATGSLVSPTRNRVPVTLVDVHVQPGAEVTQLLPASHNGFLYVLEGEARIGIDAQPLRPGQVGWLDRVMGDGETALRIANAGAEPLRVLLYTGQRQNIPLAWYGPFIGDTRADIVRSFERYQAGTFLRV